MSINLQTVLTFAAVTGLDGDWLNVIGTKFTLAELCEYNELNPGDVIHALATTGQYELDAGSNGDEDKYLVKLA